MSEMTIACVKATILNSRNPYNLAGAHSPEEEGTVKLFTRAKRFCTCGNDALSIVELIFGQSALQSRLHRCILRGIRHRFLVGSGIYSSRFWTFACLAWDSLVFRRDVSHCRCPLPAINKLNISTSRSLTQPYYYVYSPKNSLTHCRSPGFTNKQYFSFPWRLIRNKSRKSARRR